MRWTLTLIVILSFLVPLLAASICGNGVCSGDKNCSTCSLDCGKCNGGSCSLDNNCYSGICCSGVCSSSCVVYPTKSAAASPYVASVLSANSSIILGAIVLIIIIELIIAFAILRGRKKI